MKALIAAGGRSKRMRPITHTMNKHLIPLANRPMLEYPIQKLVDAGITDIIINVNPGEGGIMRAAFGDGERFGAKLTYLEQKGGALGIAHVVANAKEYLAGEKFVFFLGDNVMAGSVAKMKQRFETEGFNCMLALARVKDPNRFGVPEFNPDGSMKRAVEKPANPPSPFAITGIYFFDEKYFDAFATIKPSERGEYEITDIITWYIANGRVGHEEITGWWKDTGTPDALLEGNALMLEEMSTGETKNNAAQVDPTCQIQGKVNIGAGTVIGPGVLIRGPVAIGENCRIEHAYVGPYTSIGNEVLLKNVEIEHSIVMEKTSIDCGKRIVNSIIGKNVNIRPVTSTMPRGHRLVIGDQTDIEL